MEHFASVLAFFPKQLQWPTLIIVLILWATAPLLKQRRDQSRYWAAVRQHLELLGKVGGVAQSGVGVPAIPGFLLADSENFVRRLRPDVAPALPLATRVLWTTVGAAIPMLLLWVALWHPKRVFESPAYGVIAVLLHVATASSIATLIYRSRKRRGALAAGAGSVLILHFALALVVGLNNERPAEGATAAYGLVAGLEADDVSVMFRLLDPPGDSVILNTHAKDLLPQIERLAVRGLVTMSDEQEGHARPTDPTAVRGRVRLTPLGVKWKQHFLANAHAVLTDAVLYP